MSDTPASTPDAVQELVDLARKLPDEPGPGVEAIIRRTRELLSQGASFAAAAERVKDDTGQLGAAMVLEMVVSGEKLAEELRSAKVVVLSLPAPARAEKLRQIQEQVHRWFERLIQLRKGGGDGTSDQGR